MKPEFRNVVETFEIVARNRTTGEIAPLATRYNEEDAVVALRFYNRHAPPALEVVCIPRATVVYETTPRPRARRNDRS